MRKDRNNEVTVNHRNRSAQPYPATRRRKHHAGSIFLFSFFGLALIAIAYLGMKMEKKAAVAPEGKVIVNPTPVVSAAGVGAESTEVENSADAILMEAADSQWNLTLVNRWNVLPENYEINLVEVPGGEKVDERIYEPLMELLEAAKGANWDQLPNVVSGYRTPQRQQELYDDKIAEYKRDGYSEEEAVNLAGQWVAIPGTSEHELGLAVDINGATYDLYFWLQENSWKYGFIYRYPAGKTDLTGVNEEVWHYRYVGKEAAAEIYEQGLCLEEYYLLNSCN